MTTFLNFAQFHQKSLGCSSPATPLPTGLSKVHWRDKRMMTDEYFFTRRDNANHFVIGDGRMTGGPCQSELEQTGLRKV